MSQAHRTGGILSVFNTPLRIPNFRDIPRDLMRKVKMAAAHEGKTVKDFLIELAETRLQELERKGILPKGK
jgi:hypothetical protein